MIVFQEIDPFKEDFKALVKKYKTLNDDLEVVKKVLEILPDARPPFSFRIDNLGIENCVIKVKKIACKTLKRKWSKFGITFGLRLFQRR